MLTELEIVWRDEVMGIVVATHSGFIDVQWPDGSIEQIPEYYFVGNLCITAYS